MTLLAPGYLLAGALAALGVVLLHFIVTREPRTLPLPTARFAPDAAALARPRALRPNDLLLMLLRALLVLAAGAALARPVISPSRRAVTRIVLADRSAAVRDSAEVADSVNRIAVGGDSVIAFDSGGISAALIMGLRAASQLRSRAESLELVLVSPVVSGQIDNATDSIRALWPGALRMVRVRPALPSDGDSAEVRWERGEGRGERGEGGERGEERGDGVSTGDVTVVGTFVRDTTPPDVPAGAVVVARWMDGVPAAWEVHSGGGCVRTVRIGVPSRGDLILTPRFQRLEARLTGPCGPRLDLSPVSPQRIAALSGTGALAAASSIAAPDVIRTPLMRWLLVLALALAATEWLVRRRSRAV